MITFHSGSRTISRRLQLLSMISSAISTGFMINLTKPLVRSFLLYDFKSNMKAAESSRRINDAFGEDTEASVQLKNGSLSFERATSLLKIRNAREDHLKLTVTACANC